MNTYNLPLSSVHAEQLLRLVSIADLAVTEHYRTGWLPGGRGDAELMQRYVEALKTAPSLERELSALGEWVRKQGGA